MIYKIIILVTTFCVTNIGGEEGPSFRFDYTYNEQAEGWFKLHRIPSAWNRAKIRCHAEGAILASPTTEQQQKGLLNFVANEQFPAIFTGVHSTFSDGDYSSVDGVPFERLPLTWAAGQPNGLSKNCLAMLTRDGTMTNVNCGEGLPYVCYKKKTDLIKTQCGTHDQEYKLESRTGQCYKFHRRALDWTNAYLTCVAEGGYLAIINSDQEAQVLKEIYAGFRNEDIFSRNPDVSHIGFRDLRDGGSWMTVHGETLPQAGFDRWSSSQPDNAKDQSQEGEACGSFFRNGLLNDNWCGWICPFFCEKSPNSLDVL